MSSVAGHPGLNADRLRASVAANDLVARLEIRSSVESTNDEVRRLAREGAPEGTVVVADEQRGGRGRRGRDWYSARGLGVYLSVLLRSAGPAGLATRWTLGAAVAACRACRTVSRRPVQIEWPNDLVLEGLKLGGILVELRTAGEIAADLIVGIGLNVYHRSTDFPAELRRCATALHPGTGGGMLVRETLATEVLLALREVAERLRGGDWDGLARDWLAMAPGARGSPVNVLSAPADEGGSMVYTGLTRGVDSRGALRVERSDGVIEAVHMAQTVVPVE